MWEKSQKAYTSADYLNLQEGDSVCFLDDVMISSWSFG